MAIGSLGRYLGLSCFLFAVGCSHPTTVSSSPQYKPIVEIVQPMPFVKVEAPRPPMRQLAPLIMIDAGHGGSDLGTSGQSSPEYKEKNLTLTTAMMLKAHLEQMGFRTIMIRQTDVFINRYERARIANEKRPAVFVSIHYNFASHKEAHGIEVFYYQSNTNKTRSDDSKRLAQSILKRVLEQTGAKSRGVKHGDYAVVRETQMPAVIVEGGFLTNEKELEKLKDPAYLKALALGVAEGIQEYTQGTS